MSAAPAWAARPAPRRALRRAVAGARSEPREIEAQLVAQVRAPSALRRALASVAGRMVAARGWERLGFARLADYAAERAGISARELRDLAGVDRALATLPVLDAAFCAGEIGWTQLRLLCRVATAADQESWLALAARLSARALAREVRTVDRRAHEPLTAVSSENEGDDERVGVVLRVTPRARVRWWSARQVANRVAGRALSHGAFAELLAAEVLSGAPLENLRSSEETPDEEPSVARERGHGEISDGGVSPAPQRRPPPVSPRPASSACAIPAEVAALERDLASADTFELDRRLRLAVRLEARGLARVAALLDRVALWGVHRNLGFRSLDAYVEERLGIAPSRARALLRIERAAQACPSLREAFASGQISWVQAHALVPLLLEAAAACHREAWVAHAQRVSVRRLGYDVERALALGEFAPPPLAPNPTPTDPGSDANSDPDPAGLQTGAIARFGRESERLFFSALPEVAQLFRAVLATVQRQLEQIRGRPCHPSDALEAMFDHALAAWQPEHPAPREHAVFARDGWRCTVPGCSSYRNLQQHHVVFRSAGGGDEPGNLTTLCAWHHLRGVHARVLCCTGAAPDALRFELGLRVDGKPLAVYRSGDIREHSRGGSSLTH